MGNGESASSGQVYELMVTGQLESGSILEGITEMVVHGEIEHLPAAKSQVEGVIDNPLAAFPVGMLEGVVKDEEGLLALECFFGECHA